MKLKKEVDDMLDDLIMTTYVSGLLKNDTREYSAMQKAQDSFQKLKSFLENCKGDIYEKADK